MAWVVDTSVVLDLRLGDPVFEPLSTQCLQQHLADGLMACPITFIEVGPAFAGDSATAKAFFRRVSIEFSEPWTIDDTDVAHRLWFDYQNRRRQIRLPKRPVADVLIAAFAHRFQGIITRNGEDFRMIAPNLTIVEP